MKKLGTVKNVIHDGNIILRTSETPAPGTRAYDSRGAEVGRVIRTFGPVGEPYVSLKPKPDIDALGLVGATLYMGSEEPKSRERQRADRPRNPSRRPVRRAGNARSPVKNRGVNTKWQRKEKPRKR